MCAVASGAITGAVNKSSETSVGTAMVTMSSSIARPLCSLDQTRVRIEPKNHGMAEPVAGVDICRDLEQFILRPSGLAEMRNTAVRSSMPKISRHILVDEGLADPLIHRAYDQACRFSINKSNFAQRV